MVQQWMLLWIFLFSSEIFSQDERYYRHILSGESLKTNVDIKDSMIPPFNVKGAIYKVDLNSDGIEEVIQPQKRDGVDYLDIRNSSGGVIFEARLLSTGAESYLYKVKMVHLSFTARALILFLDEGFTKGQKFESTAKIYLLSYDNNDLGTLKLTEGAHFFHEKEAQRDQYWRRDYQVNVFDMDKDGTREVTVQYNHIQRIFRYRGKGNWDKL